MLILSATIFPLSDAHAKILVKSSANSGLALTDSSRSEALIKRLEEIKAMNFASMSPAEKKKYRKEVRSITKEVRELNGRGVYISVAGLIIIALLLILLL
jgi:hypothetical protein